MTDNTTNSSSLAKKTNAKKTSYPVTIHGVRFNLNNPDGANYIRQIFKGRKQLIQWRKAHLFMEHMNDSDFEFTAQWNYRINGLVYGYIVDFQPYQKYSSNYVRLGIAIWDDKVLNVRFQPNCSLVDVICRAICQTFEEDGFCYDQLLYLPVKMVVENTVNARGTYTCVRSFVFISEAEEKDLKIIYNMVLNQQIEKNKNNTEESQYD